MASDLGLVVHTAKRNTSILSAKSTCNRCGNRCFTNAGRANETDDLILHVRAELSYRNELKNSVLHLSEAVMVAVKNLLCILNRDCFLALDAEGVVKAGVKICAEHCSFGRTEGSFCKLGKLLVELFLDLLGHPCLGNSLVVFLKLVIVLKLAELGLKRLYLLAKEVVLLIFINLLTYGLLNISLALEDHELLAESHEQLLKSCS